MLLAESQNSPHTLTVSPTVSDDSPQELSLPQFMKKGLCCASLVAKAMYVVQAALGTAHAHLRASLETMAVKSATTFKIKSRLSVPETEEYVDSNSTSSGRCWGFDGFDSFLAHRTAHNPALVQGDFLEAICIALRTIIASTWFKPFF